jgi:CBS domain-containing membrane protein
MGATAVLLFALPASPLAQPWAVIGGNVISALVGVACVHWLGNSLNPALLGALAAALALGAMFALRCLHPPGGAVALITVIGGPAVQTAGYQFAMLTVLANSAMMVLLAILYNNLTGGAIRIPSRPISPICTPPRMKCRLCGWASSRTIWTPC